jgi:hypothetical protein
MFYENFVRCSRIRLFFETFIEIPLGESEGSECFMAVTGIKNGDSFFFEALDPIGPFKSN